MRSSDLTLMPWRYCAADASQRSTLTAKGRLDVTREGIFFTT
jgi:hypothetical protein